MRAAPSGSLLGCSQGCYFNEAYDAYVQVGCAIERVVADRVHAALRDAGGAVSELTALRDERKALLATLAAVTTATSGTPIEPRLSMFFAGGACAHAPCRFLHVRRV